MTHRDAEVTQKGRWSLQFSPYFVPHMTEARLLRIEVCYLTFDDREKDTVE